jgi:ElaB/YqjD/DUF883 family membrane-anchored ribosome-binding protein
MGSGSGLSSQSAGAATGTGVGGDAKDLGAQVSARAQDLHQTIDKTADAARPVVDRLATSAHAGVDKLQGMLSGASLNLGQRQQQLTDAYGQWKEASFEYVRQKPGTAIAIAAAAGFVLAKLLGGRNRSDY